VGWDYSWRGLELAEALGQLGAFLTCAPCFWNSSASVRLSSGPGRGQSLL
jgi:hypothetical protein